MYKQSVYIGQLIVSSVGNSYSTTHIKKGQEGRQGGQEGCKGGQKGAREGKKGAREGKKGAAPFYFGLAGTLVKDKGSVVRKLRNDMFLIVNNNAMYTFIIFY